MVVALIMNASTIIAQERDQKQVVLEEVDVVTSIKDQGLMREQPTAVTMLGKQELESHQVTSLKGTGAMVPNLFMPDYGSRMTSAIYIRGIGSRINTPAVGLYVDNIAYIDKSAFDFNLFDIERIDVLRGPQGTLYGRNSMGGLVRINTKNPFNYQGTNIKLGYASGDNHRNVALSHYHKLGEKFAFAAGGYYEAGDGFFTNDITGKKVDDMQSGGGRIRGIYRPSSRWELDLTLSFDHSNEGAYPYYYTGTIAGQEQYESLIGKISNNRYHTYRRNLLNTGLNVGYKANKWELNMVTAYQYLNDAMMMDQDFIQPDIYTLEQRQRIHTLTEEVVMKSRNSQRWQWINGLNLMLQTLHTEGPVTFYDDGMRWLEGNINRVMPSMEKIPMLQGMGFAGMGVEFTGPGLFFGGEFETPLMGAAIFHQSTVALTSRLSATLGLRLDYEHQEMKYEAPAVVQYNFRMTNSRNERMSINLNDQTSSLLYGGEMQHDRVKLLPKVALKYAWNTLNNAYASVSMGQRSGGYNLQMFSDLLQGMVQADMMTNIQQGVGSYMKELVDKTPNMPKQIPDPENPGQMIALPDYVQRMMAQNMPTFEQPNSDNVVYKPEYSINYELGTHLTYPEQALNIDAALYYNRIYDQQIARFAPTGLGRMMVNASSSQSMGGELAMRWSPISQLSLTANYGYTYATFIDYDDGKNDYSGNYVPYVPKHTACMDAAYTFKINNSQLEKLTVGATVSTTGRLYWTEDNRVSQPIYTKADARIEAVMKAFSVTLWARNLTNTKYNSFYFESAGRGFEQHGKPMQIGVDVNVKFKR